MTEVEISEATNRLPDGVERVSHGEEIVITRSGERVARLVPPEGVDAAEQARRLAARIRKSRGDHALGGGSSLRALIEEGRP